MAKRSPGRQMEFFVRRLQGRPDWSGIGSFRSCEEPTVAHRARAVLGEKLDLSEVFHVRVNRGQEDNAKNRAGQLVANNQITVLGGDLAKSAAPEASQQATAPPKATAAKKASRAAHTSKRLEIPQSLRGGNSRGGGSPTRVRKEARKSRNAQQSQRRSNGRRR